MNQTKQIIQLINDADAVVVGAGAGLSTSAGFTYSGERFKKYFSDFEEKYGFHDMYSGSFNDYESFEEMWAFWSRLIYINRYMAAPKPVYEKVLELIKDKNYFVITTNVDHCFQNAGIDKNRLFYTQGDYGLWQCSKPCHKETYDNGLFVENMIREQGFRIAQNGNLELPENGFNRIKMSVSSNLVPKCPECGEPMAMNLRSDNTFVEDEGWNKACGRYEEFLNKYKDSNIVFLELGVGGNTPGIIKYSFWHMTYANPKARYICINKGEAVVPQEIEKQSICVNDDIYEVLNSI